MLSVAKDLGYARSHIGCIAAGGKGVGGTATLVSDKCDVVVSSSSDRAKGNITITNLVFKNIKFKNVNIYAPQDEENSSTRRDSFYKTLKKIVTKNSILGGDFQNVLDILLDLRRTATSPYENGGSEILRDIISTCNLTDEIRMGLGLGFDYTHSEEYKSASGASNICQSRIDRLYNFSHPDIQWTSEILPIKSVTTSDHAMVTLKMELKGENLTNTKKELITLDAKLLSKPDFYGACLKLVHKAITAAAVPNSNINSIIQSLKFEVRKIWKCETKKKRVNINVKINFFVGILNSIHQSGKFKTPNHHMISKRNEISLEIEKLKRKLNPPKSVYALPTKKREECMSREFWQRSFTKNNSSSFINEFNDVKDWNSPPEKNTELPDKTNEIADASAIFFSHLGSKRTRTDQTDADAKKMLDQLAKWGVNTTTSDMCGADISIPEVEFTCSNLPREKSPGPDRIPNEFYKSFAKLLAPLLARYYNEARAKGMLPNGFSDGIVVILYKKGSRCDIRNYRPITLLNSDYKIMTRILAKRMLSIVTQFVSDSQIGFVPFTFIAESAMLIKLIQVHLDKIDDGGILVFCDLEKAFDRCDWNFLNKAIAKLNFSESHQSWFNILYDEQKPPSRKVYANGKLSKKYNVSVGVAQGCPLSPLTFLIIIESLTRLIDNDPLIKGLEIAGTTLKSRHFADDTWWFQRTHEEESRYGEHMRTFASGTNQVENEAKREKLPVGIFKHKNIEDFPGNPANYTKKNEWLISLGIPLGNDFSEENFWKTIYTKAKAHICKVNYIKGMSLVGRHRILNANFYGRFRYWLWSLNVSDTIHNFITTDATKFLWRSSPDMDPKEEGSKGRSGKWINREASPLPLKKGGGGIMDWKLHAESFPAMWMIKIIAPREAAWKSFVTTWLNEGGFKPSDLFLDLSQPRKRDFLKCIPKGAQYLRTAIQNFWNLAVKSKIDWKTVHPEVARAQPIFENFEFSLTSNRSIIKFWQHHNFCTLADLVHVPENRLISRAEIKNKLSGLNPSLPKSQLTYRVNQLTTLVKSLPEKVTNSINASRRPLVKGDYIAWHAYDHDPISGDSGWRYGKLINGTDTQLHIQELIVDTSGTPTPAGLPHTPINDSFPTSWDEVHRLALWGNPNAKKQIFLRGKASEIFPPDEQWTFLDEKLPIRLSNISISRITKAKQALKTGRPSCELKWQTILKITDIPWGLVWSSLGTFLTTPKTEKHWHWLLHRNLLLKTADKRKTLKRCRLCNFWRENQNHILGCRRLAIVKHMILKISSIMGVDRSDMMYKKAWLLGLDHRLKLLPEAIRALLRIYWTTVYRNMTLVVTEKIKFNSWRVKQEICRDLMQATLAYQSERQKFALLNKFSKTKHILPASACLQAAPLGSLDTHTGILVLKPALIDIFKNFKVWTSFNPND